MIGKGGAIFHGLYNCFVSQSREMRGSRVRGYNVSTPADRGHGSSEAGQNRQLERGPSRQADA